MFTGIVEEVGEVLAVEHTGEYARLRLRGPVVTEGVRLGDSIAVAGVCLTVTSLGGDGDDRDDGRRGERERELARDVVAHRVELCGGGGEGAGARAGAGAGRGECGYVWGGGGGVAAGAHERERDWEREREWGA